MNLITVVRDVFGNIFGGTNKDELLKAVDLAGQQDANELCDAYLGGFESTISKRCEAFRARFIDLRSEFDEDVSNFEVVHDFERSMNELGPDPTTIDWTKLKWQELQKFAKDSGLKVRPGTRRKEIERRLEKKLKRPAKPKSR